MVLHQEPPRATPRFHGPAPVSIDVWGWGTDESEKKKWVVPAIDELKQLQQEGVTGVGLCCTFFMRRVQPLKARANPLFQYAGPTDPTRELEANLPWLEVKAWVVSMLKMGIDIVEALNNHPSPRSHAHNP
ncbi:hypothetical protein BAE44_0026133 [Dichanthelium oligosanthes]|uniref:Uncharacterized protein n=1 Tax=Dichanthelium oligosanthes TaxID=888268 RepID=A0A1E5UJ59_9POAL|nr:hypothetical protein BAE44_0026133 [Dichanthelium oligosanthes]